MVINQPNYNPQNNQQNNRQQKAKFHWIKYIVLGVIYIAAVCVFGICMYFIGSKNAKTVAVDFTVTEDVIEYNHKYQFLSAQLSNYICDLSEELELDPNLVVSILMVENPEFNPEAIHRNENGTIDCGLFQLNDRYIWTTFKANYWFDNLELDPFNWKHNCYLAMHHIEYLQKQLKLTDEVIMAYNCGIGAVMNETVPAATKVYLAKVKNNITLLKGVAEND